MSGAFVYKYFACKDPDRYFEGTGYNDYREARDAAAAFNGCVIEAVYTFDDSEMVDDFRKEDDKTDEFGFDDPDRDSDSDV